MYIEELGIVTYSNPSRIGTATGQWKKPILSSKRNYTNHQPHKNWFPVFTCRHGPPGNHPYKRDFVFVCEFVQYMQFDMSKVGNLLSELGALPPPLMETLNFP